MEEMKFEPDCPGTRVVFELAIVAVEETGSLIVEVAFFVFDAEAGLAGRSMAVGPGPGRLMAVRDVPTRSAAPTWPGALRAGVVLMVSRCHRMGRQLR